MKDWNMSVSIGDGMGFWFGARNGRVPQQDANLI